MSIASVQCSVGRFCFYRKLASMFPSPSTDHGLISSIIKEGGNIDAVQRNDYSPGLRCIQGDSDTLL